MLFGLNNTELNPGLLKVRKSTHKNQEIEITLRSAPSNTKCLSKMQPSVNQYLSKEC